MKQIPLNSEQNQMWPSDIAAIPLLMNMDKLEAI